MYNNAAKMKEIRDEREALGLCKACGGELDDPTRKNCSSCRKNKARWDKNRAKRLNDSGRCAGCGGKLKSSKNYQGRNAFRCPKCNAKKNLKRGRVVIYRPS